MVEPPVPTATAPVRAAETSLTTFLLTDIEGSTRLWEEHASAMGAALASHDRLLRAAVEANDGRVVKTTGDGILAAFADPCAGIDAALQAQRALRDAPWGETGPLRVRMALHSGTAELRDDDYFGPALNRVARLLAIGHGGQVLCSAVCSVLARDRLPATVDLVDLGSHRLRDLDRPEQVFQLVVPDLPSGFPPLRSLSTRRSNLPVQLTSFVGRDRELGELDGLVRHHRLVTLIGTGGTGKTRLMLEVANRIADRFPDGAWLAELAPLTDPGQIASEVARALGVPEVPGTPAVATVTAFLADKEVLLLLDNAEHLVDGVAEVSERLLASAPRLRILTTSREALAVPGEAILQLPSLSCPSLPASRLGSAGGASSVDLESAAATEAVRLFTERARAVAPDFRVDGANVGSVAEICRRLDGIPLAIELAAARVSALSPEDIAAGLGDRFRLLAGGRRTAVPRQQTLHALIDWSWDLLTDDDRRLLRRLSVFAGGWSAGMAARIVGDGSAEVPRAELLDGLTRLIDRSLVVLERGTTTRYRMLETIRQYAREKLISAGEAAEMSDRHFRAFEGLVLTAEAPLRGPGMVDWLDRLDADAENIGAALEWGLEADPWEAVRMATALLAYWSVRVASEDADARTIAAMRIALERLEGRSDADPKDQALAARLLGEGGRLFAMNGRAQIGMPFARAGLELARASGDPEALVQALGGVAVGTVFTGGGPEYFALFAEAADIAERNAIWWVLAMATGFTGAVVARDDREGGEALLKRAMDAAERSGSPYAIGAVAIAAGRLYGHTGRPDEAAERFGVAVTRFTELGDERLSLAARSDLAHALRRGGRFEEAQAIYLETTPRWVRLGHRGAVANQLENVAYIAIERGELRQAAELIGAAQVLRETAQSPHAYDEVREHEAYLGRLAAELPAAELATLLAAGRRLPLADAVALIGPGQGH